mgnify:CR=1 FL=1
MWAGALCVLLGGVCIEVHKFEGGHEHFKSWHALAGIAAYALALMQPLLKRGFDVPTTSIKRNSVRRRPLRAAMAGHVLGSAELTGLYTLNPATAAGAAAAHGAAWG